MVFYEQSLFKKEEDTTYKNRVLDAFQIVQNEFDKNICYPSDGKYFGVVECEITNLGNKIETGWSVFSIITLYTINLLGFPIASQLAAVELTVKK